jgi:folate-dependent phosphoribosylglycinamide formyltransferase PurN
VHVQEFVLQNNLKYAGQTLHIVAEDYDVGPTIAEHKVIVRQNDTPASLFERVKKTEKKYLPKDIDDFINKRIKHSGRLR